MALTDDAVHMGDAHYCTAFDSGYLSRGLAMISSLRDSGVRDEVVVLCLDDVCLEYLAGLELANVALLSLRDLERATPRLVLASSGRSKGEYIFTCIPALIRHVLEEAGARDFVAYLDADVYFYTDPSDGLFGELHRLGGSVGLTSHGFPENLTHLARYGDFNAGCVVFRNDEQGCAASTWWSEACLDWCWDYPDNGRYANQGYLNDIARQFEGAFVLPARGLNVAPWNISVTTIRQIDMTYYVEDGTPLVFFHFHGLQKRGAWMYTGLRAFKVSVDTTVLQGLYASYVLRLEEIATGIASINNGSPVPPTDALAGTRRSRGVRTLLRRGRGRYLRAAERLRGEAIRVPVVQSSGPHQKGDSL